MNLVAEIDSVAGKHTFRAMIWLIPIIFEFESICRLHPFQVVKSSPGGREGSFTACYYPFLIEHPPLSFSKFPSLS